MDQKKMYKCEKCGHVTDGYGNYVSKLAKENKELKEKLEALTKA